MMVQMITDLADQFTLEGIERYAAQSRGPVFQRPRVHGWQGTQSLLAE